MKKFEGILLCTDLDGTLLRNDKSISRENLAAIEYFKKEGGIFTLVTGRMPFSAAEVYQAVQPNGPFGCINGGGIFDHRSREYVWTLPISKSVLELVEYAVAQVPGIGVQVNTFEHIYFCRENSAMATFREDLKVPNLTCHYREVKGPIAKVVFGDDNKEHITKLQEVLTLHPRAGEFDFIRSELRLFEILPKGISKGTLLLKLAELLNIARDKTIAIGDYDNDASMLRAAGTGIAVANASPAAKEVADYITVSNEEHAIARIIDELDAGKL